ncbi:MAG: peroxidase family protein, partial [Acidobacteriota bacterium]|nr:peroxidase family protein [Acidobacteriota bacterium]
TSTTPEPLGLNDMMAWWLFQVHIDIAAGVQNPAEPDPIDVPLLDDPFDLLGTGVEQIAFNRAFSTKSIFLPFPTREIFNLPTAYLDADPIYQRNERDNLAVRTLDMGRLELTQAANGELVLPTGADIRVKDMFALAIIPDAAPTTIGAFPGGAAIGTLLAREHNRVAARLDALNPGQKALAGLPEAGEVGAAAYDEALFQLSRKIVEAEMQAITYHEVLPSLGVELEPYSGYDDTLFPAVGLEFSTAPFRVHTMLTRLAPRIDADGVPLAAGPVDSARVFEAGLSYADFRHEGMDPIVRGMLLQPAQKHDLLMDDGLRSIVPDFDTGTVGAFNDLMATHINRGRDRGLPDYDEIRTALGLTAVTSFADVTSDPA